MFYEKRYENFTINFFLRGTARIVKPHVKHWKILKSDYSFPDFIIKKIILQQKSRQQVPRMYILNNFLRKCMYF